MKIRPMLVYEESDVRHIYRLCHPMWPAKPRRWYEAHPTLVLEVEREIVGFTCYSLGPPPKPDAIVEGEVMYGHGVYVRPDHRRRGYGRKLTAARLEVAREVGCHTFVGMTQPGNEPMIRLFDADGMQCYGEAPRAYPDGSKALIYIGRP